MIKNHPFANGNKRMAVALMMYFMYKNKKWAKIHPMEMYDIACTVAESDPTRSQETIDLLRRVIKEKMHNLS